MYGDYSRKLTFVSNPGSSSRKYALYDGNLRLLSIDFEKVDGKVACETRDYLGKLEKTITELTDMKGALYLALRKVSEGFFDTFPNEVAFFAVRVVAPGDFFAKDRLVDAEFVENLKKVANYSPEHAPILLEEIDIIKKLYPKANIVAISDSAFHNTMPPFIKYYPISLEVADGFGIKRYGYHGLSLESTARALKSRDVLPEKTIVLHLGSGSSVTALRRGKSLDTSMGFSPLEGMSSSTRSGSIDVSASIAIKKALNLNSSELLEKYLNDHSGLLGVSQKSGDMREIIKSMLSGDIKSHIAFEQYINSAVGYVGKMFAVLGGADALVFTGAIGFRSALVRSNIVRRLEPFGFRASPRLNVDHPRDSFLSIASSESKPIFILKAAETSTLLRHSHEFFASKTKVNQAHTLSLA